MKIVKQDGTKKEFTMDDGSIISFDEYKPHVKIVEKPKEEKKKKYKYEK